MSEAGAKSSQALASKGEKDASEKRGRGRPRKKPQVRSRRRPRAVAAGWEAGVGRRPRELPPGPGNATSTRWMLGYPKSRGGPQPSPLCTPPK
uniref:Uncharacterized protein n=1 Tax=Anser cygnoides TaxID=8845 RepID=A0A8B9IP62_ANSCY